MTDASFIRSSDGDRRGIEEGRDGTEIVVANHLITGLVGQPLVQFRMGYGVHLEAGSDHEVTIETPFEVEDGDARSAGEPSTAGAAGALLPLIRREITSARVGTDGTLTVGLGSATVTVPPALMYEPWGAGARRALDRLLARRRVRRGLGTHQLTVGTPAAHGRVADRNVRTWRRSCFIAE
jgi:hypothetical protein